MLAFIHTPEAVIVTKPHLSEAIAGKIGLSPDDAIGVGIKLDAILGLADWEVLMNDVEDALSELFDEELTDIEVWQLERVIKRLIPIPSF